MSEPAHPPATAPARPAHRVRQRPYTRFSWTRIGAMVLRHLYVMRSSWTRLLELAYWPTVQMVLWGFITVFFREHSSWVAQAAGVLISAVLLWDVLFRSNLGVSISFLEEIWARNLSQLFVSPLRPYEMATSLLVMALIRTVIGITPAALLAIPLYDVSVFALGPGLVAFFVNVLVMGWALGLLVTALVVRFGPSAESLCWGAVFVLAPVSGIYYPVETLPVWLRPVAFALPSTHVFEGMRGVLYDGHFRLDSFLAASGLNLLYMAIAVAVFLRVFEIARRRGLLLKQGE